LLSRKSTWSDDDVGRFTRLVRQDHIYEQAEVRAKEAAAKAEDDVDKEFSALMRAILNRYHEEQVWSDKIRSASTYGSLAVLGLNVLVFVMATIFIEPWKRRRLAATFEKKVDDMDAKNSLIIGDGMAAIHDKLDKQEQALWQLWPCPHPKRCRLVKAQKCFRTTLPPRRCSRRRSHSRRRRPNPTPFPCRPSHSLSLPYFTIH
jgi:sensitive to high expression protein 9